MQSVHGKFTGVVLAGGKSSRMGKDKSTLRINNLSLLDRAINVLTTLNASTVLTSRNDFSSDHLPDIYPNNGPLSGIHSALFHSDLPILCVPVDMPLLDTQLLSELLNCGTEMNTAVIYQNHNLPLYLPNTDDTRHTLENMLTDKDQKKSIGYFLNLIGYAQLKTTALHKLVNVNTPIHWQQMVQFFQQQQSVAEVSKKRK